MCLGQCFIPAGKGKAPCILLHSSCTEASQDLRICLFLTSQKMLQRQHLKHFFIINHRSSIQLGSKYQTRKDSNNICRWVQPTKTSGTLVKKYDYYGRNYPSERGKRHFWLKCFSFRFFSRTDMKCQLADRRGKIQVLIETA